MGRCFLNDEKVEFKPGDIVRCFSRKRYERKEKNICQLGVLIERTMVHIWTPGSVQNKTEKEGWLIMTPEDGLMKRSEESLRHVENDRLENLLKIKSFLDELILKETERDTQF